MSCCIFKPCISLLGLLVNYMVLITSRIFKEEPSDGVSPEFYSILRVTSHACNSKKYLRFSDAENQ